MIPFLAKEPLYTEGGAVFPYSKTIVENFTFKSRYDDIVPLYKVQGKNIIIPVGCAPLSKDDRRVVGSSISVDSKFKPRSEEQERVVSECSDLLVQGTSHIVKAATGFGKTVVGAEATVRVGVKTLVIVTKEDIIKQWVASYRDIIGIPQERIGLIQANVCDVAGKDVVIAMVHSVSKAGRYPSWIYKEFGLIIFDEVHRMAADQFSQCIWLFPAKLRLGLSAITDRKDGKAFVFKSHIGEVLVETEMQTLVPKVIIKDSGWSVPTTTKVKKMPDGSFRRYQVPIPHKAGRCMHIYKMMARNRERNLVICEFIKKAYEAGRSSVVFSDLRAAHLDPINHLLIKMGIPKDDIGMYVGVTTKKDKAERELAKAKPIVLTTYKMTSEATDVPWWDTAVLCTPRSDVNNIVGRIRREYEGKKEPIVFDMVDGGSNVFTGYAKARQRWYRSIGCEIVRYT